IGGIAARLQPARPDTALNVFCALGVRRHLERLKQPVEADRLVAALEAGKIARGFGKTAAAAAPVLLLSPPRLRQDRGRSEHCRPEGGLDSRAHDRQVYRVAAALQAAILTNCQKKEQR